MLMPVPALLVWSSSTDAFAGASTSRLRILLLHRTRSTADRSVLERRTRGQDPAAPPAAPVDFVHRHGEVRPRLVVARSAEAHVYTGTDVLRFKVVRRPTIAHTQVLFATHLPPTRTVDITPPSHGRHQLQKGANGRVLQRIVCSRLRFCG
jgi:hypothetical protein